jgi:hypothetical protein
MNWDAIGAIGEIAGAIGVIVTLIYLAIQLRQNTRASHATAVQNSMENSARFSELISTDRDLGRTFWLGLSNPEELNAEEMRRFVSILNVFMRRESVAYYLYQEGTMPKELWAARVASLTGALNQPGLKVYLESAAESLPSEFRAFVEQIAAKESSMKEETKKLLTQRDA